MKYTSLKCIAEILLIAGLTLTSCTTNSSMDNTPTLSSSGAIPAEEESGPTNNPSADKKYFKNLQASLAVPAGFQEVENQYSYSFVSPDGASVYIASVYVNQSSEQVKQMLSEPIQQNGYEISLISDFVKHSNGMLLADAKMVFEGVVYPGYIILREMPNNNTYLLFGCVEQRHQQEEMKRTLNTMAQSIETGTTDRNEGNGSNKTNMTGPVQKTVEQYQHFLMDKVLINNKQSSDMISGDDHRASHGKWILSEDVSKTRRFLLCSGGFSYYRFVSTGHQMSGDYGTVNLDKWSGYWKIVSEAGKIYIYMEDERDKRYRVWEINGISDNIIFIDNRPYTIFTQQEGGNECGREGGVLMPE